MRCLSLSYRVVALAAIGTLSLGLSAQAQVSYPDKPITLVVPFTPGSGSDIVARIIAKGLADSMKATVVIDNKPGANGALGAQAVARAKPDGYTLLLGSATTNAVNYAFFPGKLSYEPSSFDMIAGLGASDVSMYINSSQPWRTIQDLIAEARKNPGKLSCGSGNAVTQVACEFFKRRTGIDVVTVPYKSNAQSLTDLAGAQLTFVFSDSTAAQAFIAGKKVRSLASAGEKRSPIAPEVATFAEQGLKDFEFTAWTAVFAPAGTPVAVAEKLNAAINKISDGPEMAQLRSRAGSTAMVMDLAAGNRFVSREVLSWKKYVEETGVKAEQ
jgi:tripartite-type tricarboxylate transporter receptor subunit TctC